MEHRKITDTRPYPDECLLEGITLSELIQTVDRRCNEISGRTVTHVTEELLRERTQDCMDLLQSRMQEIVNGVIKKRRNR